MHNSETLFSVVVPAYNRRQHIEKLISRFAAISFMSWELLIVDDGSVDDTKSLFENNIDSRVKYVRQENKERGAARNCGLKIATGKYVTFLDSDDYLKPEIFDEALKVINSNPGIPVFHLGYETRNSTDEIIRTADHLPDYLNDVLIERNVIACLGLFIDRNVALNFLFNEDRGLSGTEDYELWIRLASHYPIKHFNITVAVLVEHEGRSMLDLNVEKTIKRIELFIQYSLSNPHTSKFLGARKAKFIAFRYSYISLHAALASEKSVSISYLKKALVICPKLIFNKRFVVIVKKLILG